MAVGGRGRAAWRAERSPARRVVELASASCGCCACGVDRPTRPTTSGAFAPPATLSPSLPPNRYPPSPPSQPCRPTRPPRSPPSSRSRQTRRPTTARSPRPSLRPTAPRRTCGCSSRARVRAPPALLARQQDLRAHTSSTSADPRHVLLPSLAVYDCTAFMDEHPGGPSAVPRPARALLRSSTSSPRAP